MTLAHMLPVAPRHTPPLSGTIARRLALWATTALALACAHASPPDPLIGTFTLFNRESPFLIAAPHGEFDVNTDEIVYGFCEAVRWDCLIAEGFRENASINVNRPTEGISLDDTRFTERATLVYSKYVKRIQRLSPRVRFYAEIHGQDHPTLANTIDIATVGLTPAQGEQVERIFASALLAAGLPGLVVRVDVLENIRYKASHARKFGVLSFISPAIHIELPLRVRTTEVQRIVSVLVHALPQIATETIAP